MPHKNHTIIHTVLVPAGAEYKAVKQGLSRVQNAPLLVAIPAGPQGLEAFLRDGQVAKLNRKGWLLMGLGGSLASGYGIGEPVALQKIWNHLTGEILECDAEITEWLVRRLEIETGIGVTCDRIITTVQQKQQLGQTYRADVVDMEGAILLKSLSVTGGIVRVISDDCEGDLPDIGEAIAPNGSLKPVQMALGFAKKPKAALRLIRGSLKALKELEALTYRLFS